MHTSPLDPPVGLKKYPQARRSILSGGSKNIWGSCLSGGFVHPKTTIFLMLGVLLISNFLKNHLMVAAGFRPSSVKHKAGIFTRAAETFSKKKKKKRKKEKKDRK